MKWRLIVGLGSEAIVRPDALTAIEQRTMSWYRDIETKRIPVREAADVAMRTIEAMIEHATKRAKQLDPILITELKKRKTCFSGAAIYYSGILVEVRHQGPTFMLDSIGCAIAAGRDAVDAGVRALQDSADIIAMGSE